jgi:hypothetical protein
VKKYAVIATLLTDEELTGSYCESEGLLGHTGLSLKDKILDDVRVVLLAVLVCAIGFCFFSVTDRHAPAPETT